MNWKTLLAYVSGSIDEEIQKRNEYLVAENRVLQGQIEGRLKLTDAERITLARLGKELGAQALAEVATIVKPETILAWHRRLVAKKFDGSLGVQESRNLRGDRIRGGALRSQASCARQEEVLQSLWKASRQGEFQRQ